jgi:hypothetical protein
LRQLNQALLYIGAEDVYSSGHCGGVAEWLKAPVLKTGDGKPFESSNLSSSAIKFNGSAKAGPFCFARDMA